MIIAFLIIIDVGFYYLGYFFSWQVYGQIILLLMTTKVCFPGSSFSLSRTSFLYAITVHAAFSILSTKLSSCSHIYRYIVWMLDHFLKWFLAILCNIGYIFLLVSQISLIVAGEDLAVISTNLRWKGHVALLIQFV